MNCFFDIETIPAQDPNIVTALRGDMKAELDEALAGIRAPSNYKDEAKIAEYVNTAHAKMVAEHEAAVQAAYLKTALDGSAGQVCVIGWTFDDSEPIAAYITDAVSERHVLQTFFAELQSLSSPTARMRFIGHHIIGFDLRFLWQRAMVLGIKPPGCLPRSPKPWDDGVFDTMLQWAGDRGTISMDNLCRALGLPGKGDISGKDVWPMVQAGRISEVADYCRGDVERTRAIYNRMTFA